MLCYETIPHEYSYTILITLIPKAVKFNIFIILLIFKAVFLIKCP